VRIENNKTNIMKIFSEEWIKDYSEKLNSNKTFKQAADGWFIKLVLTIDDEERKSVFLDLENGKCKSAKTADNTDTENAEYIISASKDSWKKILNSELDPMLAVMTKKLELKKGNVGSLLKYIDAAKELLKSASQVNTEF
jgi:putative sterol carrier protein